MNNSQNINNDNDDEDEKLIIVFDLGGGTFDVTLLNIEDQEIFNVLSNYGLLFKRILLKIKY